MTQKKEEIHFLKLTQLKLRDLSLKIAFYPAINLLFIALINDDSTYGSLNYCDQNKKS
jgi:hypothetical protein